MRAIFHRRLTEYANANAGLEPVIELTSFYSYLMNDGYSEDFKKTLLNTCYLQISSQA